MDLCHEFAFEAAHWLPAVPPSHPCSRVHGHSWRVTVAVTGPVDARTGWVLDFAELRAAVEPLRRELDHRLLNEVQGLENPTAERLALWVWDRLEPGLPGLCEVQVAEGAGSWCRYRGRRA